MISNFSLDMLNESLTYIICKTVRYFVNNFSISQLHAYILPKGTD